MEEWDCKCITLPPSITTVPILSQADKLITHPTPRVIGNSVVNQSFCSQVDKATDNQREGGGGSWWIESFMNI